MLYLVIETEIVHNYAKYNKPDPLSEEQRAKAIQRYRDNNFMLQLDPLPAQLTRLVVNVKHWPHNLFAALARTLAYFGVTVYTNKQAKQLAQVIPPFWLLTLLAVDNVRDNIDLKTYHNTLDVLPPAVTKLRLESFDAGKIDLIMTYIADGNHAPHKLLFTRVVVPKDGARPRTNLHWIHVLKSMLNICTVRALTYWHVLLVVRFDSPPYNMQPLSLELVLELAKTDPNWVEWDRFAHAVHTWNIELTVGVTPKLGDA